MIYKFRIIAFLFSLILPTFSACKDSNLITSTKEADESELKVLLNEIEKMSDGITCTNASDWRFVPIGSKPCGGSTHFVLYSVKIDTNLFLQKVEQYTQKQKNFNVKYQLSSDCKGIVAPKYIACINEKPKLVY
ncbi:hypothetical protein [Pedobacter jamesrossensis]|uniref:Lipoprotein n=1 Tax=Pedobacter jamesrossensis TaxID=1908238 RepID=A0ABV8NH68_9SPHI